MAVTLTALAMGLGGCAAAAIELVPLSISAAGAVSHGVMNMATNSAASHDLRPGEDEVDRRERCDNLAETAPAVIELRRSDAATNPQWRELQVANATGEPHWAPAAGPDGDGSWRPTANLLTMDFSPPLAFLSGADTHGYLSYAPAEPVNSSEQDELSGLTVNFGAPVGTFHWNGRVYQYATAAKLPCFSLVVALN